MTFFLLVLIVLLSLRLELGLELSKVLGFGFVGSLRASILQIREGRLGSSLEEVCRRAGSRGLSGRVRARARGPLALVVHGRVDSRFSSLVWPGLQGKARVSFCLRSCSRLKMSEGKMCGCMLMLMLRAWKEGWNMSMGNGNGKKGGESGRTGEAEER